MQKIINVDVAIKRWMQEDLSEFMVSIFWIASSKSVRDTESNLSQIESMSIKTNIDTNIF